MTEENKYYTPEPNDIQTKYPELKRENLKFDVFFKGDLITPQ